MDIKPIGEVLGGIEIRELTDGDEPVIPMDVMCIIKVLDANGNPSWIIRTTNGMSEEEMLGIITAIAEQVKQSIMRSFQSDVPDEDEDGSS